MNAMEVLIARNAKDDAERERRHAELYAEPIGNRRAANRKRANRVQLSRSTAENLIALAQAEDSRYQGGK